MYTDLYNDEQYRYLNISDDAINFGEDMPQYNSWNFDENPSYAEYYARNGSPLNMSWGDSGAPGAVLVTQSPHNSMYPSRDSGECPEPQGAGMEPPRPPPFSGMNIDSSAPPASGISLSGGVPLGRLTSGITLQPAGPIRVIPSPHPGLMLSQTSGVSLQPARPVNPALYSRNVTPYPQGAGTSTYHLNAYQEPRDDIFDTPSKKRKRMSTLPDPVLMRSAFDHEEALSQLSSDDLLEYTTIAGVHRKFSKEEREFLDKIAKKIKNRESARRSRANKKNKMKDLEKQMREKDQDIQALKSENDLLKKENQDLRNQVSVLTTMVNNRSSQNTNPQDFYSKPFASPSSTVLFIFLFTFGLLWNLDANNMNFFGGNDHSTVLSSPDTPLYIKEMVASSPLLHKSNTENSHYMHLDEQNKK